MTARASAAPAVVLACCLAGVVAGAWYWRGGVFNAPRVEVMEDAWDHVPDEYPLLASEPQLPAADPDLAGRIVSSNPFSPDRRPVAMLDPDDTAGSGEAEEVVPPSPQFTYKGQVHLGTRQRAIVEDTVAGKTYFLEVGQEVAEFKVLDIGENQVVLSNIQSSEDIVVSLATAGSGE